MDMRLSTKRAFVSGSTQGIGFAIARGLLDEGVAVVVNGRDEGRVRAAVERLEKEFPNGDVSGIAANFEKPDEVDALLQRLGHVDILVNNVGLFDVRAFAEVSDGDWQRFLDVNLMSGVRLSRGLIDGMLTRGWGRIIFTSSESGVSIPVDMVHYGVTKAAMLALGNGLAKLTRGTEVTVNSIVGGPTYSDGVSSAVDQIAQGQGIDPGDLKAAIIAGNQTSLLGRFIEPAEIARLAVYLASPLSSATNGAALRADGGVLTATL